MWGQFCHGSPKLYSVYLLYMICNMFSVDIFPIYTFYIILNIINFIVTAYQSFIRAYATYPHELKSIFHLRHLHLGHVAKTFGLRAAPSDMSNIPGVDRTTLDSKRSHGKGRDDSRLVAATFYHLFIDTFFL